jgi:hypothetical protein
VESCISAISLTLVRVWRCNLRFLRLKIEVWRSLFESVALQCNLRDILPPLAPRLRRFYFSLILNQILLDFEEHSDDQFSFGSLAP